MKKTQHVFFMPISDAKSNSVETKFHKHRKKNPKIQADMHDCIVYAIILITK